MHNASRYFQKLIKEEPENHRDLVIADLRDFQMKLPPGVLFFLFTRLTSQHGNQPGELIKVFRHSLPGSLPHRYLLDRDPDIKEINQGFESRGREERSHFREYLPRVKLLDHNALPLHLIHDPDVLKRLDGVPDRNPADAETVSELAL